MPKIGVDCDIMLTHTLVNGGDPYGFLLLPDAKRRSAVLIRRETYLVNNGWQDRITYRIPIAIADHQTLPSGKVSSLTRADQYEMLMAFLDARTNLTLETKDGTYEELDATVLNAEISEFNEVVEAVVTLNNGNLAYVIDTTSADFGAWWFDTVSQSSEILTIGL